MKVLLLSILPFLISGCQLSKEQREMRSFASIPHSIATLPDDGLLGPSDSRRIFWATRASKAKIGMSRKEVGALFPAYEFPIGPSPYLHSSTRDNLRLKEAESLSGRRFPPLKAANTPTRRARFQFVSYYIDHDFIVEIVYQHPLEYIAEYQKQIRHGVMNTSNPKDRLAAEVRIIHHDFKAVGKDHLLGGRDD